MSALQFVAQLVSSLAWPLVGLFAIVFLRSELKAALRKIIDRIPDLKRLKAAGVELDFQQEVQEVAKETRKLIEGAEEMLPLKEAISPEARTIATEPSIDENRSKYLDLAENHPKGAVLASFADLEVLIRRGFRQKYPDMSLPIGFTQISRMLVNDRLLPRTALGPLRDLNHLRNQVAHEDIDVDSETARRYVQAIFDMAAYVALIPHLADPERPIHTKQQ